MLEGETVNLVKEFAKEKNRMFEVKAELVNRLLEERTIAVKAKGELEMLERENEELRRRLEGYVKV